MKNSTFYGIGAATLVTIFATTMHVQKHFEQKREAAQAQATATKWQAINALPFAERVEHIRQESAELITDYNLDFALQAQLDMLQHSLDIKPENAGGFARNMYNGIQPVSILFGAMRITYDTQSVSAATPLIEAVYNLTSEAVARTGADDPALTEMIQRLGAMAEKLKSGTGQQRTAQGPTQNAPPPREHSL